MFGIISAQNIKEIQKIEGSSCLKLQYGDYFDKQSNLQVVNNFGMCDKTHNGQQIQLIKIDIKQFQMNQSSDSNEKRGSEDQQQQIQQQQNQEFCEKQGYFYITQTKKKKEKKQYFECGEVYVATHICYLISSNQKREIIYEGGCYNNKQNTTLYKKLVKGEIYSFSKTQFLIYDINDPILKAFQLSDNPNIPYEVQMIDYCDIHFLCLYLAALIILFLGIGFLFFKSKKTINEQSNLQDSKMQIQIESKQAIEDSNLDTKSFEEHESSFIK